MAPQPTLMERRSEATTTYPVSGITSTAPPPPHTDSRKFLVAAVAAHLRTHPDLVGPLNPRLPWADLVREAQQAGDTALTPARAPSEIIAASEDWAAVQVGEREFDLAYLCGLWELFGKGEEGPTMAVKGRLRAGEVKNQGCSSAESAEVPLAASMAAMEEAVAGDAAEREEADPSPPPLANHRRRRPTVAVPDEDASSAAATTGSSSPAGQTTRHMSVESVAVASPSLARHATGRMASAANITTQALPADRGHPASSPSASNPTAFGRRQRIWTDAMCITLLKLKAYDLGRAPAPRGGGTIAAFCAKHGLTGKQVSDKLWHLRKQHQKGVSAGVANDLWRWLDKVYGEEVPGEGRGGVPAQRRRRGQRREGSHGQVVDSGAGGGAGAEAVSAVPSGSSPAAASNSAAAAAGDAPAAEPAGPMQQIMEMIAGLRGENEELRKVLGARMQELRQGQDELLRRVVGMEDSMAWQRVD
ncbi:hypothetical protein HDU96_010031 [Phlyctochytrium bullatum]|nr:hypothetical protein HDU96_010031 [Phlyctochytrium bullatum]